MTKPKPTLNLFDFDDLPEIDNATLAAAGAELADKAERSRALREDLVFPSQKRSLLPLSSVVRWECHFCQALNVARVEASPVLPLGESGWFNCDECRRDQHLQRTGEDVTDPASWEFLMGLVAYGDVPPRKDLPSHAQGADSFALGRLEDQWPHAYAFVAQARKHGLTDPALTPVQVSPAGRREFNLDELARYANELLRGVRSIKPEMTPERWAQATAKARELGGKS